MSDVFTLHGSPHSQFTYKVALMLNLSRQPFSFRYVSFQKGVHLTPEFRELSRWGQVPVLQHGSHILVQSGAILEYLAATLGKFGSHEPIMHQRIRE
jgi:glutathione S-transferase